MSVTHYIDNRWQLEGDQQRAASAVEKKQFAYRIWKEELERNQKREDRKESDIKDTWTEVYQLVGFDNVFQGVWFQGVTQLAAQRGCSFSAIPIILSVFVSLATIVGVYLKISRVRALEGSLKKDRVHSTGLQSCMNACEQEGVNFDFVAIETAVVNSTREAGIELKEAAVASGIVLLVSLTIASILFAWLLYLIMCGQYV